MFNSDWNGRRLITHVVESDADRYKLHSSDVSFLLNWNTRKTETISILSTVDDNIFRCNCKCDSMKSKQMVDERENGDVSFRFWNLRKRITIDRRTREREKVSLSQKRNDKSPDSCWHHISIHLNKWFQFLSGGFYSRLLYKQTENFQSLLSHRFRRLFLSKSLQICRNAFLDIFSGNESIYLKMLLFARRQKTKWN